MLQSSEKVGEGFILYVTIGSHIGNKKMIKNDFKNGEYT